MNTSFTPGPWRVKVGILHPTGKVGDSKSNDIRIYAAPENESNWVADCGRFYSEEQKANARLIKTAPELLEALQAAMFYVPVETKARVLGDLAIDKALGYDKDKGYKP